ncbi:MAG TPA: HAD-IA family hydrolase [Pseudonocardia sp.]|nr:HAD-IA family hydrolase [Pseudonocardia sp.]
MVEAVVPLLVTHGSSLPGGGVRAQPETGRIEAHDPRRVRPRPGPGHRPRPHHRPDLAPARTRCHRRGEGSGGTGLLDRAGAVRRRRPVGRLLGGRPRHAGPGARPDGHRRSGGARRDRRPVLGDARPGTGGARLALLSNAPAPLAAAVRASTWSAPFEALVFSCEIGCGKPAAGAYAAVEEALGVDRPVFFDDRPENVAAARERGWRAYLWSSTPDAEARLNAL